MKYLISKIDKIHIYSSIVLYDKIPILKEKSILNITHLHSINDRLPVPVLETAQEGIPDSTGHPNLRHSEFENQVK